MAAAALPPPTQSVQHNDTNLHGRVHALLCSRDVADNCTFHVFLKHLTSGDAERGGGPNNNEDRSNQGHARARIHQSRTTHCMYHTTPHQAKHHTQPSTYYSSQLGMGATALTQKGSRSMTDMTSFIL